MKKCSIATGRAIYTDVDSEKTCLRSYSEFYAFMLTSQTTDFITMEKCIIYYIHLLGAYNDCYLTEEQLTTPENNNSKPPLAK